ncbi:MAG: hypothetical protein QXH24_06415 [Candidatus Bathyarchaeia archaeon]
MSRIVIGAINLKSIVVEISRNKWCSKMFHVIAGYKVLPYRWNLFFPYIANVYKCSTTIL